MLKRFCSLHNIPHSLFVMLFILLFAQCGNNDVPLSGDYTITYDLLKTKITVVFVDAATKDIIANKSVKVTVTGEFKDAVVDISGLKHNTYNSANGFMTLALLPDDMYKPSENNPVRFSLKAEANGYITASKSVTVKTDGNYHIKMFLINSETLADGVVKIYKTNLGNIVNDTLIQKISVSTPNLEARLIIPEKTVLLDNEGKALSGPLKILLEYFSNKSNDVLSAFPGGIVSSQKRNGAINDGMFYSAGFVSFTIYGNNGKKAVVFQNKKPVLEMLVDAGTYNPVTKTQISAGDMISVFNFNTDEGIWNYEQNDTILEYTGIPPVGDYVVTTEITTALYYGIGWFVNGDCNNPLRIAFDSLPSCKKGFVSGILKRETDSSFVTWIGSATDDTLKLFGLPQGIPLFVDWETPCNNVFEVSPGANPLLISNSCMQQVVQTPLLLLNANTNTVTVEMNAYCPSNPDVEIKPTLDIWHNINDTVNCLVWNNMKNGQAEICGVNIGDNITIGTYCNGHWYQWNYTVDDALCFKIDFEFPSDVCSGVFGM